EGPDFNQLRDLYMSFKTMNPKTARTLTGFVPLDDKQHPPLQIADMIANNILAVGMEWLSKGDLDTRRFELPENMSKFGMWNEDYLLSVLKSNLAMKGQPIPLDLDSEAYGD